MVKLQLLASFIDQPNRPPLLVCGRDAWTLRQLHDAGGQGCKPYNNPAPRWSAYVFNLRQIGFDIETIREPHKGRFPGTHAQYVLHSQVLLTPVEQEEAA